MKDKQEQKLPTPAELAERFATVKEWKATYPGGDIQLEKSGYSKITITLKYQGISMKSTGSSLEDAVGEAFTTFERIFKVVTEYYDLMTWINRNIYNYGSPAKMVEAILDFKHHVRNIPESAVASFNRVGAKFLVFRDIREEDIQHIEAYVEALYDGYEHKNPRASYYGVMQGDSYSTWNISPSNTIIRKEEK